MMTDQQFTPLAQLMDAVLALPAKYRVPIYLHYYEDYSCDEVAALLHIPSTTVRTRLRRALIF